MEKEVRRAYKYGERTWKIGTGLRRARTKEGVDTRLYTHEPVTTVRNEEKGESKKGRK